MKRLLFLLTLTLVSLTAYATGQDGDIIYIDGTEWVLLGKPVYADSVLSRELKAALPERHGFTTANWAGYTACWSIQQDKLFLDSISYQVYDGSAPMGRTEYLSSDTLLRVFKKYTDGNGRIVATWYDDDIRVAKGKMIYYVHDGYMRNYENERLISIKHGEVREVKNYQNYVIEGFAFEDVKGRAKVTAAELKKMFPLHLEKYPELAGVKRIMFSIKRACVDTTGHLIDCEVRVIRPDDNPQLAAEMAEAMKAYHPWRVMFINGEYRAYGIQGYTFPYLLDDNRE